MLYVLYIFQKSWWFRNFLSLGGKFSLDYFNLIINYMHKQYICHIKQFYGLWQMISPCTYL